LIPPNDWEIKKCLVACFGLFLATLIVVEMASLGLDLPGLRQVLVLLFIALVPGVLILRILKIHNVSILESFLYSIGLSILFVIFIGVILNFTLPPLRVAAPLTLAPLIIAMAIVVLILSVFAYKRDKLFVLTRTGVGRKEASVPFRLRTSFNPFLLAVSLPLVSVLGVNLANVYQNNIVLLALIFIIAVVVGLVAFNKFISQQAYPFMLFMIALSLFYQTTLYSGYLIGSDIHLEDYLATLVLQGGYWDASIANSVNSCLSVVIVAPVHSLLLGIDIVSLFKIVYPLFFCLVPLGLYRLFSSQIGPRYAFLSAFFFVSLPMFFMDMPQLIRQQFSELFFVLVMLLIVDRKLTTVQRTILVVLFSLGVISSYYGLGTGYAVGYIAVGMSIILFLKSRAGKALWQWLVGKSNSLPDDLSSPGAFNKKALFTVITINLVFMFLYYGFVASGTAAGGIRTITEMAPGSTQGIGTAIGLTTSEPLIRTAIGLDFTLASPGGKVWRVFQYMVELCFILGFLRLVFRPASLGKLRTEYIAFIIVSVLILGAIFLFPLLSYRVNTANAYGMGITRIWQITLLVLSPLFIFGGEMIVSGIARLWGLVRKGLPSLRTKLNYQTFIWFPVVVILIPYFVFNSGAIFELSRSQTTKFIDMPYSISLSSHRLDLNTVFTLQDLAAAGWLCGIPTRETIVYVDHHGSKLFINQADFPCSSREVTYDTEGITLPGYFYLRSWNISNSALTFATGYATRQSIEFNDLTWFKPVIQDSGRIYNNGGAQVLILAEPRR
jgi:uncharacterized membrane protein